MKRINLFSLAVAFAASFIYIGTGTAHAQIPGFEYTGQATSDILGNISSPAAAQQIVEDPSAGVNGLFTFTDVAGKITDTSSIYDGDSGNLSGSYSGGLYTLSFNDTTKNQDFTIIQGGVAASVDPGGYGFTLVNDTNGDHAAIDHLGTTVQASYTNIPLPNSPTPAPEVGTGAIFGLTILACGIFVYAMKRRPNSTIA